MVAQRPLGAAPTSTISISEAQALALPARSADSWILVLEAAASSAVAEVPEVYGLSSFTSWPSYSGCYRQHNAALKYFRLTLGNPDK